jgi:hypothetical protein
MNRASASPGNRRLPGRSAVSASLAFALGTVLFALLVGLPVSASAAPSTTPATMTPRTTPASTTPSPASTTPSPASTSTSPSDAARAAARADAARKAAAKKATFGIGPANAKGLDGRPYLSFLASPGSRLTDRIAVLNLGIKKVTLNLYVADAVVGTDGAFGYLARSAPRTDAATWITPETPGRSATVTLGPRGRAVIPMSLTVPANASPGDHAAGIILSLTSRVTSSAGERVDFEQRVALRTFIRISGPLHPQLTVENLTARYGGTLNPIRGGAVTVHYRVHNTGNVRLGARQTVTISGLLATRHPGKALPDVPLLLPGSSFDVTTTVHGVLPQLRLTAQVKLFPLTVAGDVNPGLPPQFSGQTSLWAIPWGLGIVIGAVFLLVVIALLWRRLRRRRSKKPLDGSPIDRPDAARIDGVLQ